MTTLSDEKGRKNVSQLIDCGTRVYPVGRLDMDSEGLLLFTNDGDFVYKITHPKHEVNKTYTVTVKGIVTKEEVDKLDKIENIKLIIITSTALVIIIISLN